MAYNDDHTCPISPLANLRLTSLQFITKNARAHYFELSAAHGGYLSGDPALVPDPNHANAAILTTMEVFGDYSKGIGVYRVQPDGRQVSLGMPHRQGAIDDKESVAVDPRTGAIYVAWDLTTARGTSVVIRRYSHDRWSQVTRVAAGPGWPDVAVATDGRVAIAYASARGIRVRVSGTSWSRFSKAELAIPGLEPGSADAACPLRRTVGVRQRVSEAPRVVFDRLGRPTVVAALRRTAISGSQLLWTRRRDGGTWQAASRVAPSVHAQFNVAMSASTRGVIAVAWLETSDGAGLTYLPQVALLTARQRRFASPITLMTRRSGFPSLTEAYGNSECYGVGDYVGISSHGATFVAAWPSTNQQTASVLNSDVYARSLRPLATS